MKDLKITYYIVAGIAIVFILFAFLPMNTAILIVGALILLLSLIVVFKGQKKQVPEAVNEVLPNNYQLINNEQIRTCITNIEPLNEEDINELKRKTGKRGIIMIICLLVIIGMPFLSGDINELKDNIFMLVFFLIFIIVYTIVKYIRTGTISNNYNNCLKAKLYIYDKKVQGYDESGEPKYYVRVWDGNRYVINEWLYLPSTLYNTNEVKVYFVPYRNELKIFIYNEKGI